MTPTARTAADRANAGGASSAWGAPPAATPSPLLDDWNVQHRLGAVAAIEDQERLVRIATTDWSDAVRAAAVAKIADVSVLQDIARTDTSEVVRLAMRHRGSRGFVVNDRRRLLQPPSPRCIIEILRRNLLGLISLLFVPILPIFIIVASALYLFVTSSAIERDSPGQLLGGAITLVFLVVYLSALIVLWDIDYIRDVLRGLRRDLTADPRDIDSPSGHPYVLLTNTSRTRSEEEDV